MSKTGLKPVGRVPLPLFPVSLLGEVSPPGNKPLLRRKPPDSQKAEKTLEWSTILRFLPVLTVLTFLLFLRFLSFGCEFLPLLTLLVKKWEIRRPGTGCISNSETGGKAAPSLKGGLRACLEGLEVSRRPCTNVLSVSGFLVIFRMFPGSERFILAGKRCTPLCAEASPL